MFTKFNKIVNLTNIGIAVLFIFSSTLYQNISFTEHLVDNNFFGAVGNVNEVSSGVTRAALLRVKVDEVK